MNPLHATLDLALSDAFTGDRQQALSLILAQVRERFSPGEFRHALRQVWPEPLTDRTVAQEMIDEKMEEGLEVLRQTGDPTLLTKWVANYLDSIPPETRDGR